MSEPTTYPETYLHVEECRSGETWIVPLRGNASLNLRKQVAKWVRSGFAVQLVLAPGTKLFGRDY